MVAFVQPCRASGANCRVLGRAASWHLCQPQIQRLRTTVKAGTNLQQGCMAFNQRQAVREATKGHGLGSTKPNEGLLSPRVHLCLSCGETDAAKAVQNLICRSAGSLSVKQHRPLIQACSARGCGAVLEL